MKLYRVSDGAIIQTDIGAYLYSTDWDELINRDDLIQHLSSVITSGEVAEASEDFSQHILAPIHSQEVWAAGVTYFRSRTARMAESHDAGADNFYNRIYTAERPELFFKATPHRVAGPGQRVRIRRDSRWNVPEPELALVITRTAKIIAFTIGNDMSSRDIEGENPLYLPQAKVYDRSCALGPCVLVSEETPKPETEIRLEIVRDGSKAFTGSTNLAQLKRSPESLVEYLFRDNSFPNGCVLLTGTGIVPTDDFTLHSGDEIRITIDCIGTLTNIVE
ncbi:MAG TPA: fumarylacetoacetate hydrolase family protein [Pyrinomonadaceae bacterium]|jgi:Fumarylacetoacetate (FAA) hydrolase family protein|nr:fumarylacetoacetate hydrolase family protein [Pyrinomonadaceae bacterium]